jgi:tetratricopeptide (TPR) repeat protein
MVVSVAVSPDGSLLATLDDTGCVRWWDSQRFQQIMPPCLGTATGSFHFIHRDVAIRDGYVGIGYVGMGSSPGACYIRGSTAAIEFPPADSPNCEADELYVIDSKGTVYDRKSGKRLAVPEGRTFSDILARFAIAGRWFIVASEMTANGPSPEGRVTDLRTEKRIGRLAGVPRYVPDRQSFIVQGFRRSSQYLPIASVSLDAGVAQLFPEVVTCHRLDPAATTQLLEETEWEERRRNLQERLNEHSSSPLISRLAADRWHWLRRQAGRAQARNAFEDEIKYLNRLIVVEPTWQNYQQRAEAASQTRNYRGAALDILEAGKRAGSGYWHCEPSYGFGFADHLLTPATGRPEDYQAGLQLAQAYSDAKPEDLPRRVLLAIAHYRVGHYREALSLLESWRRERERAVVCHVGQFLMRPWPVPFFSTQPPFFSTKPIPLDAVQALAFEAMTHHRLGHSALARVVLADLRTAGSSSDWSKNWYYSNLLHEAEALIERRPQSEK